MGIGKKQPPQPNKLRNSVFNFTNDIRPLFLLLPPHPPNKYYTYKPAELVALQSEVPKPAVPTVVCCSILFKEGVDIVALDGLYLNTQPSCHIISTVGQNTYYDSCCGDLYLHNYLFSKVKVSLQSWGWVLPFVLHRYSTYRHSSAVVGFLTSKVGHTRYPNDSSIFLKGTFSISFACILSW